MKSFLALLPTITLPDLPFRLEEDLAIVLLGLVAALLIAVVALILRSILHGSNSERHMQSLMKKKDYPAAIQFAKKYLENKSGHRLNPNDRLYINTALGEAQEATGSLSAALNAYVDASVLAAKRPKMLADIQLKIARLYIKLKNSREASAYYQMVLSIDPGHPEALFDLAKLADENKQTKKARELLEKLLAKRPGLLDARFLYGRILFESAQYSAALKQWELLRRYDYENPSVYLYRARTFEAQKRYTEALKEYRYILNRDWKTVDAALIQAFEKSMLAVVQTALKLKDFEGGIKAVKEYLEKPLGDETRSELLYLFAVLLWNSGDEYLGLKNFEKVQMMRPGYKDVGLLTERFRKILPLPALSSYFTSDDTAFDQNCRLCLGRHQFRQDFKNKDFALYTKGQFAVVFYRHIEPIPFSGLTDIEAMLTAMEFPPQNFEIYSLSGVREDALTHMLLRSARVIEGNDFLQSMAAASA